MGELGGYHVHFELAKGDKGRPVYAFYNCPDLKLGGVKIINEGRCRAEMFSATLDPIALLESANAKLPHPQVTSQALATTETAEHGAAEVNISLVDREQLLKLAKLYLDSPYQLGGTGTLP